MGVDFSQFKDMTPEGRARELQKVIANLKAEIEDRQKDIRTAEHFLALAEEEARLLEQVQIPSARELPKSEKREIEEKLVPEKEEKKEKRLTRQEQLELEKLLATAPPRSEELFHRIAHRPISELYGELRKIYDKERSTGIETQRDRDLIYAISRGIYEKKKDIEEGQYKPARKDKHLLTAAEQMAESMYESVSGGYKRNSA
jgi:hypothetical protein